MSSGGWWHNYVCPTHHIELDPSDGDSFQCRYGCELTGEPYTSASITLQHQATARRIRRLAHHDPAQAVELLRAYAGLYAGLADGGWSEKSEPWMLRGKLFAQALSEAIWATQIADAVVTLGSRAADHGIARLLESLLDAMTQARRTLVDDRDDLRNNYTAWLDAAGALVSTALTEIGRPADIESWRSNVFEHVRVAVLDDGWEWEGSSYYHLFVLRAYLLNLRGTTPAELPVDVGERLIRMLTALTSIATPGGALPMLSDGPYARDGVFQEIAEVCALGRQLCPVPGLDRLEAHARSRIADDLPADIFDGWFGGPPLPVPDDHGLVTAHRDVGIVVIRDPSRTWQAIVDAGVSPALHGSHRHASQLSLYLYGTDEAWQPAPGVPPYASRLRSEYYPRAVAHPTVVIDGVDPKPFAADLRLHGDRVVLSAASLRREVVMTSDYLLDVVTIRAAEEHDVALGLRPGDGLEVNLIGPRTWRTRWASGTRPLHGFHVSDQPSRLEIRPTYGTSDDPTHLVAAADWSARASVGADVTFISVYRPGDAVDAVELRPGTVSVTAGGSTTTHDLEA